MIFSWLRRRRRERLLAEPFPAAWRDVLHEQIWQYRSLPTEDQQQLQNQVQILIAEKNWEGCGGLTLTDEIKVTIAGLAALLIIRRSPDSYRRLLSILVYPESYVAAESQFPLQEPKPLEAREGESWAGGPIILNWAEVLEHLNQRSGSNLVLHEFSHQLDPQLSASDRTFVKNFQPGVTWKDEMASEYRHHVGNVRAGRPTLLDRYGTRNHAEFFAVTTECFFERPRELHQIQPELYQLMAEFYRQDPAAWRF